MTQEVEADPRKALQTLLGEGLKVCSPCGRRLQEHPVPQTNSQLRISGISDQLQLSQAQFPSPLPQPHCVNQDEVHGSDSDVSKIIPSCLSTLKLPFPGAQPFPHPLFLPGLCCATATTDQENTPGGFGFSRQQQLFSHATVSSLYPGITKRAAKRQQGSHKPSYRSQVASGHSVLLGSENGLFVMARERPRV